MKRFLRNKAINQTVYFNIKPRIITYLIILILVVCCKQNDGRTTEIKTDRNQIVLDSIYSAKKFDRLRNYRPLSLNFKGKPILRIGQKTSDLDSTLSYRMDPNLDYRGYESLITDYLTIDSDLSIDLGNYSSLNGIVFFSADRKSKRIFNVSASWYFDLNQENKEHAAIDSITKQIFPILRNKIQLRRDWSYEFESENQIEIFKVRQRETDKGWNLNYEVKLKLLRNK